jgi:thioredoxin reductase (NADPH)
MATDGLFVAIGHAPAVELFAGKLKQKPNGYLWTAPDSTVTECAGRLSPPATSPTTSTARRSPRPVIGCMAALEAERYIAEMEAHREAAE